MTDILKVSLKGVFFILTLCGMMTLVSCIDNTDNIGSLPSEEPPSAKDNLPWPLYKNMDTVNYRPGDNFFMYCNGHFWETADMGGKRIVGFYDTDMPEALKQLKASVTNPVYEQLKAHEGIQLTNAQFYAFLKPFFEKIDGIQCYEDAFRVAGELRMTGTQKIINLYLKENKVVRVIVETNGPFDVDGEHLAFMESDNLDDVYQYLATHPSDIGNQDAYYEQMAYWDAHEEEAAEYEARADAMVRQYLLPALGLKAADLDYQLEFKNWLFTPLEELKAYMKMLVFRDFATYSNQQGLDYMRSRTWDFESPYSFAESMTSALKTYLDNRLVIERYISPQLKREVESMCEEIRDAYCQHIQNVSWASTTTKDYAINRIKNVLFYIGYPDRWVADFPDISHCSNMLEDMQALFREYTLMRISLVGASYKENTMNYEALTRNHLLKDNSFYEYDCNNVLILAPFVLPPFYEENMHPAMKYGMLMNVVAHELSHAIGEYGSTIDEWGDEFDWMTVQDRMAFNALRQQLADLYNRFTPLPDYPDIHTDGEWTLEENMADICGLEVAHSAFVAYCQKQGFKGEDLKEMERKFFQSHAEYYRSKYGYDFYKYYSSLRHAFDKERVNGVVMNIDRWYELYNVQPGDNLYLRPEDRIHIW